MDEVDNHGSSELDPMDKLDEAALLREAARLLGAVETDRSHLEAKLLAYSHNADKMIQELQTRLSESQDRSKELESSLNAATGQIDVLRDELAVRVDDFQTMKVELETRYTISVREKQVLSDLNYALLEENKELKVRYPLTCYSCTGDDDACIYR
jgi:septal ring factor EnvC (AmiA/AmiB activator)